MDGDELTAQLQAAADSGAEKIKGSSFWVHEQRGSAPALPRPSDVDSRREYCCDSRFMARPLQAPISHRVSSSDDIVSLDDRDVPHCSFERPKASLAAAESRYER